jgi:Fe-S-cluster containining protein
MKSSQHLQATGTCSQCGECCRWLPVVLVRQCKPHQLHYLRERGLKEADGFFLADAPCRHLHGEEADCMGVRKWTCSIYETRPATCRDFCGKVLSGGKRYYVPEGCSMAADTSEAYTTTLRENSREE